MKFAATLFACSLGLAQAHPQSAPRSQQDLQKMLALRAAEMRAGRPPQPRRSGTAVEPSLVSGKVVTPHVNVARAPGQPIIQFTIDPGNVGYQDGTVQMVSPSGAHGLFGFFDVSPYPPDADHRPITLRFGFEPAGGSLDLYSEPGDWTVTGLTIFSSDNQFISYSADQIAALFSTVTVNVTNNGTPDTTPPTFGQGEILTPVVSLGSKAPYFAIRLAVADDISGVASVNLEAALPGMFPLGTSSTLQAPIRHGNVVSWANLPSGTPTGTYTITTISVCDDAGNCVNDTSAADIRKALGTTRFRVTP